MYDPRMTPWHRFTQMAHLVSLGLWLGTVVMSSAAAAVIFPTLKRLDARLPAYEAYDGPHWLLAAGEVAERVFLIGDLVQFPCAIVAVVTLGLLIGVFRVRGPRVSLALRVLGLTVAAAALAAQLLIVSQAMNRAVTLYRAAALAGETETALRHQAAFNDLHPIARILMATVMVSVLVALAAGAWGAGGARDAEANGSGTPASPPADEPRLEEPRLLKGQR